MPSRQDKASSGRKQRITRKRKHEAADISADHTKENTADDDHIDDPNTILSLHSMESLDLQLSDSGFSTVSSMHSISNSSTSKFFKQEDQGSSDYPLKPREIKRKRWLKTAEVLQQSGLLDITIKTADLLRKNKQIQKEITDLQKSTQEFVLSVLRNPENEAFLETIRSQKEIYEMLIPGSLGLMSKSAGTPEMVANSLPLFTPPEKNPQTTILSIPPTISP